MCLNFYQNPEYFTKCNDLFKLNGDQTMIIREDNTCKYASCYGNINIVADKLSVYTWKFKVLSCPDAALVIGIDASNKVHIDGEFYANYGSKYTYYAFGIYTGWGGIVYQHHVPNFKCGHIISLYDVNNTVITMELNVKDKTLKYYINGTDQAIPFEDIRFEKDTVYNMAICAGAVTMELIDYHVTIME